jgi:hypothetical protein
MANVKISQLSSLSTMTDIAQIPVVSSGTTYQITGANLQNYFGSAVRISNGTTEVNIGASGGNANISVGGVSNVAVFTTTGVTVNGALSVPVLTTNNIRSDDSSFVNIEDGVNVTGAIVASNNITTNTLITPPVAYATLTAVAGARAFINNGNLVAAGNFGAQVIGGGSNVVPVWSNGTNWYIG